VSGVEVATLDEDVADADGTTAGIVIASLNGDGAGADSTSGVDAAVDTGVGVGADTDKGAMANVEVAGVKAGGNSGSGVPHTPASLTIAPFRIFRQYGSCVASSYSVIPLG